MKGLHITAALIAAGLLASACGGAGGSPRDQIASVCGQQDGMTAPECSCFADELQGSLTSEQLAQFAAGVATSGGDMQAALGGDLSLVGAVMGASEQCFADDG